MAEPSTFIKLDRAILNHWLWKEKPFSKGQAWIDLLLIANYADEKKLDGDTVMIYKRGSIPRSVASLANRWGWNRKTVKNFLLALQMDGMVTVDGTTHGTTVTIENYGKFQDVRTTKRTTTGQPTGQPRDNRGTQYKNNKESKERKEVGVASNSDEWTPPEKGTPEYDAWRNQ